MAHWDTHYDCFGYFMDANKMKTFYCELCKQKRIKTKLTPVLMTQGKGLDSYYCKVCDIEYYCDKDSDYCVTAVQLYKHKEGGY